MAVSNVPDDSQFLPFDLKVDEAGSTFYQSSPIGSLSSSH